MDELIAGYVQSVSVWVGIMILTHVLVEYFGGEEDGE